MADFFNTIMQPLEIIVSWILITIHSGLVALGIPADSGFSWGPSIIILVVIVRTLLIPLFVKQIRAQRGLQLLQPRMAELRKKYGSDRQKMSEELMKLYKETGTNPFSSCLPILAQSPFFFGLYRTLDGIARNHPDRGVLTPELVASGQHAKIFGAPLADSLLHHPASSTLTPYVAAVMIVAMCTSQFLTQRQIMLKNMPGGTANPMAQQQKILLYVFPLVFAVSGVYFPIGVLLYWLTTNLWTMGQQFYVIRKMPAPGSKAEEAFNARKAAKEAAAGQAASGMTIVEAPAEPPPPPRQQPKRQSRTQRKTTPPPTKKAAPPAKQATKKTPAPKQAPSPNGKPSSSPSPADSGSPTAGDGTT
jgi:YidC/Oxa1 family membrane protein insertase